MLPFKIDLSGKTAVVTGGGGVLCGAMAEALAACDANVAVLSRKLENAVTVADSITAAGGNARPYACDVTDRDSIESANAAIETDYGPCDILINGAGGNAPSGTASVEVMQPEHLQPADGVRTFYELEPEVIEFVFDVNFKGTVAATQVFTRSMAERQSGCVVNISSMSAFTPLTKVGAYSAAKAGVIALTKSLGKELAGHDIAVNCITPAAAKTRIFDQISQQHIDYMLSKIRANASSRLKKRLRWSPGCVPKKTRSPPVRPSTSAEDVPLTEPIIQIHY